jgi:hypothetical protein
VPALAFLSARVCGRAVPAQVENPLLGTWNGTGADRGEKLVIDRDTITVGGVATCRWLAVSAGVRGRAGQLPAAVPTHRLMSNVPAR